MPIFDEADLIKAIDRDDIGAISFDTTVFDAVSCNLDAKSLTAAAQFPPTGISFLITDVVRGEVKGHITRDTEEAARDLADAIALVEKRWKVQGLSKSVLAKFDYSQPADDFAEKSIEGYISSTGAQLITAAEFLDSNSLLEDYFSIKPPFEKREEKKSEFPDAIALGELEGWARENDTLVLIVSRDHGWKDRAALSERLIYVKTPWDDYKLFNRADAHVARRLVDDIAKGSDPVISNAVDSALETFAESTFPHVEAETIHYFEVEFEGMSFKELSNPDPLDAIVISSDEDGLIIAFAVSATFTALASFTFLIKDEGDYIPIGGTSAERDVDMDVVLTLTLSRDGDERFVVFDVEVESSRYASVNFGYVEQDWPEEPPDDWP